MITFETANFYFLPRISLLNNSSAIFPSNSNDLETYLDVNLITTLKKIYS